jgi:hypothetical protein
MAVRVLYHYKEFQEPLNATSIAVMLWDPLWQDNEDEESDKR